MNFLLNKQYINYIDDYTTNHIDDAIDTAPFLDLHQASLKEKKKFFSVEIIKDGGRKKHIFCFVKEVYLKCQKVP